MQKAHWKVRFWSDGEQVRETVRDATFLHNEQFFAAAQKKYVYIYDKRGLEVHCLKVRPMPDISWLELFGHSP